MESILQLYGLAMVVLPVYGFVSLRNKIRHDGMVKSAALLRYMGVVVAPIAGYACLFGLALAVEAVTSFDPISEEAARSFVLAIVLGVLVWLLSTAIFSLGLLFVQSLRKPDLQRH
ncbi:MAG: hypothetical protein JSU95_13685 [Betaproteobacteria bacterium]|nr:MAG: hypothetical protein JSU95_13685 [Betaproteobacteria bacterium]